MELIHVICIAAAALAGNYVIRYVMRRVDRQESSLEPENVLLDSPTARGSQKALLLDLSVHAIPGPPFQVPPRHLPLHKSFIEFAEKYDHVCYDPQTMVFDRRLMLHAFAYNNQFLQIGCWGDGSEVLIRRKSHDPAVYWASIEEHDPASPTLLSADLNSYLEHAWQDFCDAQQWVTERKEGNAGTEVMRGQ